MHSDCMQICYSLDKHLYLSEGFSVLIYIYVIQLLAILYAL